MLLYRISPRTYSPWDPAGAAATSEGRWHRMGQRVLYFSSSLSLCVLELKANAVSFEAMRRDWHFCALELEIGNSERPPESFFSPDWVLDKGRSQERGSAWYLRRASLLFTVRSAVLPVEWNYLVNTTHPDFDASEFAAPREIPLDPRLN